MFSREVDLATRLAAVAALVAGLALSSTSLAQSDARGSSIEELLDQIRMVESRDGESSPSLIALYTELGLRYQDKDEPAHAAAATQRALEILRVNEGLYTLDQAPLIRQLIRNALALGDHGAAWELERGLLRLAERYPNDVRTARILHDSGDRRTDILERYKAGEFPPEIVLGCYYAEPNDEQKRCGGSGNSQTVTSRLVYEVQTYYSQAVNILIANEQYDGDDLPLLFKELVDSSYRYGTPNLGRRSLNYLLAYQYTKSEPWLARIETLVQIADWDLLYSDGLTAENAALAEYAEARRLCDLEGIPREAIDRLFSPEVPIRLPAFYPSPLVSTTTLGTAGHIDIGFEVDKYGSSRRVRIQNATGNATPTEKKRLQQNIQRSRFRPRFTGGESVGTGPVVVRYQLK